MKNIDGDTEKFAGKSRKATYAAGLWAQSLWVRYDRSESLNVRRLHYFAITEEKCFKPDGVMYENTTEDLDYLVRACHMAGYLGLLHYSVFVKEPCFLHSTLRLAPADRNYHARYLLMRRFERSCRLHIRAMLSGLSDIHAEIWVENSTVAELLDPVARTFNVNLIASDSEISLAEVWLFVRRIADSVRPVRILYISDYRKQMPGEPVAAWRKVMSLLYQYKLMSKLDIDIKQLFLSGAQCRQFDLPCVPRSQDSQENTASGHVELEALEAARPGYIRQMVCKHLKKHFDVCSIAESRRLAEKIGFDLIGSISDTIDSNTDLALLLTELEKWRSNAS